MPHAQDEIRYDETHSQSTPDARGILCADCANCQAGDRTFLKLAARHGSVTGILALALVGIFTAELTRPTADYLRDGFFDATAKAGLARHRHYR